MVKFVFLYTDCVLWVLTLAVLLYAVYVLHNAEVKKKWQRVAYKPRAMVCGAVLCAFFAVAMTDSIHVRRAIASPVTGQKVYATQTESLFDILVVPYIAARERSYSKPFALYEFDKTTVIENAKSVRRYARLTGAGRHVKENAYVQTVIKDVVKALGAGALASLLFTLLMLAARALVSFNVRGVARRLFAKENPWRPFHLTGIALVFLLGAILYLWPLWHVFGTDATGNDVLYTAFKSIRTAFVIGSLATVSMLPFAIMLGMMAGYFKGWVDDVIQYLYTTLSSIPSVLLIAASVLMIQVFIDKNPTLYETGLERADLRLFLLALIMGVTGWAGLARLLRAETLKVSVMDYVTAAKAFGVTPFRILMRHVFPNVAHIVLIVSVLDFSGIVLYEAVLSYVGVGVDPTMNSFGTMINAAAVEMSRTPVIWWNLLTCFIFMVALVLSANIFAAGVRDAFDPRSEAPHA